MLLQLWIRNFILIEENRIEFSGGLNVLTGETGAGKSILIDALRLALGERTETDCLRDPKAPCVIEAVFDLQGAPDRLRARADAFMKEGDEFLVLKREITPEGRSKNYVNQQFVNLSVLRQIGEALVDFHGQYDQQCIFLPATHLQMIDRLAGLTGGPQETLRRSYEESYGRYCLLIGRQAELQAAEEGKQRTLDLLDYQIREIEKTGPEEGEDDRLATERVRLAHTQRLSELTGQILSALDDGDASVSSRMAETCRALAAWIKIDPSIEGLRGELDTLQVGLEEWAGRVREYRNSLSLEENDLGQVEERLDALERLKKKYGGSLAEVRVFLDQARRQRDELENSGVYRKDLEREIAQLLPVLEEQASGMSRLRRRSAAVLVREVEKELKELGIPHARFGCRIAKQDMGKQGRDLVEFLLSPNPGETLRPLGQIASGGEASRILLALKRALVSVDEIPTLVFDEIDANIGGRLGKVVGGKLREISRERQVLIITHLPQIGSFALRHILVSKSVEKGKTVVRTRILEADEKIRELAQMMSGEKESEVSRVHAREMLKTAAKV